MTSVATTSEVISTESTEVLLQRLEIRNPVIGDEVISERLAALCPRDTYSYLYVNRNNHVFFTDDERQQRLCRIITLQATSLQAAWHLLRIVFQITSRNPQPFQVTQMEKAVLGSHDPRGAEELYKAYIGNYKLILYVAMDGSKFHDVDLVQGVVTSTWLSCSLL